MQQIPLQVLTNEQYNKLRAQQEGMAYREVMPFQNSSSEEDSMAKKTLNFVMFVISLMLICWEAILMVCNYGTFFYVITEVSKPFLLLLFIFAVLYLFFQIYAIVIGILDYFAFNESESGHYKIANMINFVLGCIGGIGGLILIYMSFTNISVGAAAAVVIDFLLYAACVGLASYLNWPFNFSEYEYSRVPIQYIYTNQQ